MSILFERTNQVTLFKNMGFLWADPPSRKATADEVGKFEYEPEITSITSPKSKDVGGSNPFFPKDLVPATGLFQVGKDWLPLWI